MENMTNKCPSCGAAMKSEGDGVYSCEYCHTRTTINQRTPSMGYPMQPAEQVSEPVTAAVPRSTEEDAKQNYALSIPLLIFRLLGTTVVTAAFVFGALALYEEESPFVYPVLILSIVAGAFLLSSDMRAVTKTCKGAAGVILRTLLFLRFFAALLFAFFFFMGAVDVFDLEDMFDFKNHFRRDEFFRTTTCF